MDRIEPSSPIDAGLAAALALAPPGVVVRPWRDAADSARMVDIHGRSRETDQNPMVLTADQIDADAALFGADPAATILLAEVDEVAVGWVRMVDRGTTLDVGRRLTHSGEVLPEYRRRGIGRSLLQGAQAHLLRTAAEAPSPAGTAVAFESTQMATASSAIELLTNDGYLPARYYMLMVRPTLDNPPPVKLPDGIEVRPAREDERLKVLRAMNEAMLDHRAWTPLSEANLLTGLDHPLYGQADVWQVAWQGDEVVGGVLGYIDAEENAAYGRRRGYTEGIFTLRPWRGRGVATALIGANLALLRARGMTEAALGVDTENPSGAARLYERLGFVEEHRAVTLRRLIEG